VELLVSNAARAVASVHGTEVYRVELHRVSSRLAGRCECPAFENSPFCKHMVAVALAAPQGAIDRFDALREHLLAQPPEALVARLLSLAERNETLRRSLEREIADALEDDAALVRRYRRDLDDAVEAARDPRSWREANDFAELSAAIDALSRLADARPAPALELTTYLLDEFLELSGEVDDSEGELFDLGRRACELHLQLCAAQQPDPVELAERLLDWELNAVTDLFHAIHEDYADVLGAEGIAALTGRAQQLWTALPPLKPKTYDPHRTVLKAILDRFGAQDLDARIALRKAELTAPAGYLEIADMLEAAGREAEALKWLEEALWVFEDQPGPNLQRRAADMMLQAGRTKEAQALLWRVFEREPGFHTYRALLQAPDAPLLAAKAQAHLRARAETAKVDRAAWYAPAATLFDIQMEQRDFDAAWETAERFDLGDMRLGELATATLQTHRDRALAAFRTLAEVCIRRGGAANYDAAIGWIRRSADANPGAAEQAAWIEDLRLRHKAKRTFIQRLPPAP
jgi:uncharacterized Zn finger protein